MNTDGFSVDIKVRWITSEKYRKHAVVYCNNGLQTDGRHEKKSREKESTTLMKNERD